MSGETIVKIKTSWNTGLEVQKSKISSPKLPTATSPNQNIKRNFKKPLNEDIKDVEMVTKKKSKKTKKNVFKKKDKKRVNKTFWERLARY